MKESELERILVEEVRKVGGIAYKWISPGNDGVPDRIVILPPDVVCFVELKADRGHLSPMQKIQISRMRNLGADVRVVKGMSGLIEFFRSMGYYKRISQKLQERYLEETK